MTSKEREFQARSMCTAEDQHGMCRETASSLIRQAGHSKREAKSYKPGCGAWTSYSLTLAVLVYTQHHRGFYKILSLNALTQRYFSAPQTSLPPLPIHGPGCHLRFLLPRVDSESTVPALDADESLKGFWQA